MSPNDERQDDRYQGQGISIEWILALYCDEINKAFERYILACRPIMMIVGVGFIALFAWLIIQIVYYTGVIIYENVRPSYAIVQPSRREEGE